MGVSDFRQERVTRMAMNFPGFFMTDPRKWQYAVFMSGSLEESYIPYRKHEVNPRPLSFTRPSALETVLQVQDDQFQIFQSDNRTWSVLDEEPYVTPLWSITCREENMVTCYSPYTDWKLKLSDELFAVAELASLHVIAVSMEVQCIDISDRKVGRHSSIDQNQDEKDHQHYLAYPLKRLTSKVLKRPVRFDRFETVIIATGVNMFFFTTFMLYKVIRLVLLKRCINK